MTADMDDSEPITPPTVEGVPVVPPQSGLTAVTADATPIEGQVVGDATTTPELSKDARRVKIWNQRIRGLPVSEIAQQLGLSEKTVRKDIAAIGQECREKILKDDAVQILASNLQFLDEMERIALYEVSQSRDTVTTITDRNGGQTTIETPNPNKSRFFQSALDARKMTIRLLMDTGIIPKNKTDLFSKLDDLSTKKKQEESANLTDDQIKDSIRKLLTTGRIMKHTDAS